MIVCDASAVVELLLGTPLGRAIAVRVADPEHELHAPQLLGVEVTQALRRWEQRGWVAPADAARAIVDLRDLGVVGHPHDDLLPRAWALRANLTIYDGVYVALAEALACPLVTCDRRLARAPGHRAAVEVVTGR